MRLTLGLALLLVLPPLLMFAPVCSAGTIAGQLFTAESPDSIAPNAIVTLSFHGGSGGDMKRIEAKSDAQGHFHFMSLAADTSIAYLLQITYRGRDFLSNTIRFAPGQEQVDYNVLLSDVPPTGVSESDQPPMIPGRPAHQSPVHTILIVMFVVLVYSLLATLARRQEGADGREVPPEARALIREIASLDVRHEDGIIGEEEYRKVRVALINRLRSLGPRLTGNTG